MVWSHWAQVFIGIEDFSSDPGRVCAMPLPATSPVRAGANRRSMVAADIDRT